jgi:hypothetical protein
MSTRCQPFSPSQIILRARHEALNKRAEQGVPSNAQRAYVAIDQEPTGSTHTADMSGSSSDRRSRNHHNRNSPPSSPRGLLASSISPDTNRRGSLDEIGEPKKSSHHAKNKVRNILLDVTMLPQNEERGLSNEERPARCVAFS